MKVQIRNNDLSGKQIYKLAQSGTPIPGLPPVFVVGNGSKPISREDLKKKAKKKMITQKLALSLINIAQKKKDKVLEKTLWNTYYCQNKIITAHKSTYGKYCKNRFCLVCLGIRKAELINKYYPIVSEWEEPYFLTLTAQSCKANILPKRINNTLRALKIIVERYKKRHQRGKGIKLYGIRSIECNFNPIKKTYNPHLHLIVPNREIAEILRTEWLSLWTEQYTSHKGQDSKKVYNTEKVLVEIIKYSTKIFTEPDPNSKNKKKASHKVYIAAMYNIISAMKDHRLFDRFGFNLPKTSSEKEGKITQVFDYDSWIYNSSNGDWFSEFSGQVLADYHPDIGSQNMLTNNIDVQLQ